MLGLTISGQTRFHCQLKSGLPSDTTAECKFGRTLDRNGLVLSASDW